MNILSRRLSSQLPADPSLDRFADAFERQVGRAFHTDLATYSRVRANALADYRDSQRRRTRPGLFASLWASFAGLGRPVTSAVMTIALLAGSAGLVSVASGPGQMFYSVRLVVEEISMPPLDSPARLHAEIARLDKRINEAAAGAEQEHLVAVEQPLEFYGYEIDDVVDNFGPDRDKRAVIHDRIGHDEVRLAAIARAKPKVAKAPVARTLGHLAVARQRLEKMPFEDIPEKPDRTPPIAGQPADRPPMRGHVLRQARRA